MSLYLILPAALPLFHSLLGPSKTKMKWMLSLRIRNRMAHYSLEWRGPGGNLGWRTASLRVDEDAERAAVRSEAAGGELDNGGDVAVAQYVPDATGGEYAWEGQQTTGAGNGRGDARGAGGARMQQLRVEIPGASGAVALSPAWPPRIARRHEPPPLLPVRSTFPFRRRLPSHRSGSVWTPGDTPSGPMSTAAATGEHAGRAHAGS
ncbi:hypothetical protein B0J12DRAFT_697767 [Macrophomina phaseolina]|uniref:Uncharacterized protein n=1 Tax=Macrophomina phaseolina TaxID=35725 RepID=A0ABQ8GHR6_9PEZI|nr:hypothetical protein B0J12DRAFT_697767 [Macrophomina phaseolina]